MNTRIIQQSFIDAWPKTWTTAKWLLSIMIPVTIIVSILQYVGAIAYLASLLNPYMHYLGLPGHATIPLITGALVSTYAGVAALVALEFTMREATIIAIMICICHSLPMETSVVRKTGSSGWKLTSLRVVMSIVAAVLLNALLPDLSQPFLDTVASGADYATHEITWASFITMMQTCLISLVRICIMIFLIIYALMLIQCLINSYGLMQKMTKHMHPLMQFFGLPDNAAYLWIVGNVVGVNYGCAVMLELAESGQISREEINETNYHLMMNHSMVEDTAVFAGFGISALWILGTRISFALIVVWMRKAIIALRHKK